MNILDKVSDSEELAFSVPDNGGVYFVPAFVGLGAPYWDSDTRGTIVGITGGTSRAHLTRAALESIAFQSYELIEALEKDSGQKIKSLRVDGGASLNSFLMQFQADILGIPVQLSAIAETTALGAGYLAGLSSGYWKSREEIARQRQLVKSFQPLFDDRKRDKLLEGWRKAVQAARQFKI
ncbi:Glycerol kinase [subsurface metagenome]